LAVAQSLQSLIPVAPAADRLAALPDPRANA